MIRLEAVVKRYPGAGIDVLRGVDLGVGENEFVSVVGRSGSGKTTLLNVIGGLDSQFEGRVEVGGLALRDLADPELAAFRSRTIGFIFQAYHLLDHLSCADNVALAAQFSRGAPRRDGSWVAGRVAQVLAAVGLGGAEERSPTTLSGGERQRVAVARALFNQPRVLLCDEPTGNLDEKTGGEIVELLRDLHRRSGMAIVAATHDRVVSTSSDRVLDLGDGVITADGPGGA